jgi:DUF1365 family protein
MISRIYTGVLTHTRIQPVHHSFRYSVYMLGLDLGDLEHLQQSVRWFGYNRSRVCSVWDQDYLDPKGGPIVEKLKKLLDQAGCPGTVAATYLLTTPRTLNMGFNPINIFWCFGPSGSIHGVVVEVRNTYREIQPYVLHAPHLIPSSSGNGSHYRFAKRLFVSPFNGVEGVYDLRLGMPGQDLDVGLDLVCAGQPVVRARLQLRGAPLGATTLRRTLCSYPLTAAASLPRIVFQAAVLRFAKGMKPRLKPKPISSMAIRLTGTESTWFYRRAAMESREKAR